MKEIEKILNDYKKQLHDLEKELKKIESNFPNLDLNQDIFKQINIPLLETLKTITINIPLSLKEQTQMQAIFSYYEKNKNLDLELLLVKDSKYLDFQETIKKIYKKILLYKIDNITNYQVKIAKTKKIIKLLEYIQDLFPKEKVIGISSIEEKINSLNLPDNLKITILNSINEYNSSFENKTLKKEIFDIKIIDDALRKIDFAINSLKKNNHETTYLLQSRLVNLQSRLINLKEDYELCNQMIENKEDDISYLLETLEQTISNLKNSLIEFEELMNEFGNISTEPTINLEDNNRNLIFLNQTFKDLDIFQKESCIYPVRKKIYAMLKDLKDNKLSPSNTVISQNEFPIYECKGSNIIGSPRLFYQVINNNIIVLMLGISGQSKISTTKNTLESRIRLSSNNEYKTLYNAFKLASLYPNNKYLNSNLTNQEYLENLLKYYQVREEEFFELFKAKCYDESEKKR